MDPYIKLPSVLLIPKVRMIFALGLIYLTTLTQYPLKQTFSILILALGFTILSDLLFTYIRNRKLFMPYAAVVTGLIIGLIIDPNSNWYQIATVCISAMAVKNFLRISQRHPLNPAASGLFIGGIIFNQYVSWWGVSFQTISPFTPTTLIIFLILLSPLLTSAITLRRFYNILTFLITFILVSHLWNFNFSVQSMLNSLLEPGLLFFAAVMLPEPMTTPVNSKRQMFFGITVAIITITLSFPMLNNLLLENRLLADPLILALLAANLLFFKFR